MTGLPKSTAPPHRTNAVDYADIPANKWLVAIVAKLIQPLLKAQWEIGYAEGLAESSAVWRNWLDRRTQAEAKGKPFNEPPPDELG